MRRGSDIGMPEQGYDTERPEKEKKSVWAEVWSWVKCILVGIILALALDFLVIANAKVPTGSMEDTIPVGARIIGLRHAYLLQEPERGDIIIFKYPDDESVNYVKRIIGLPGETVQVEDGEVYVDGQMLTEPYLDTMTLGNYGPYSVPEDSYFVMGDNRNDSKDSRFWENKYVDEEKIVAKVMFMYFPKFRLLQ